MEHIGRVRAAKQPRTAVKTRTTTHARSRPARGRQTNAGPAARVATTTGYVDVWAGLVLAGKQFFPLARQLFSARHPDQTSQNRIEEAVLAAALALLERLRWAAIIVADRGLGRKELLVRLVQEGRDLDMRVDPDITVFTADHPDGLLLAAALAAQPDRGEVLWDRGQEGVLHCQARTLTATIRYSRSGRQGDYREATLHFVHLRSQDGPAEPLVLATTLPIDTLADIKGIVRVYAWRWAIEIVCPQLTKAGAQTGLGRRDDVPDLHRTIGHDHPVDEQLYHLPALLERGLGQRRPQPDQQVRRGPGNVTYFD